MSQKSDGAAEKIILLSVVNFPTQWLISAQVGSVYFYAKQVTGDVDDVRRFIYAVKDFTTTPDFTSPAFWIDTDHSGSGASPLADFTGIEERDGMDNVIIGAEIKSLRS